MAAVVGVVVWKEELQARPESKKPRPETLGEYKVTME